MALRVGLIGGTGFYEVPRSEAIDIETPGPPVRVWRSRFGGAELFFLPRHGETHAHVPLRVPHAAHIHALRSARCDYVIGVNNVGSLHAGLTPGSWVVPHDFLDLHHAQRATLYPDAPVHTDFSAPYCPTIRRRLLRAGSAREGLYVGVDGPRFETRFEVDWMAAQGGEVVGMTGVPEAILAHEAGLCYASLCFVGNMATGLGLRVSAKEIQKQLAGKHAQLLKILRSTIARLPTKKSCDCGEVASTLTLSTRGRR